MAKYLVNYLDRQSKISRDIYGNFAEHLGRDIYDGLWVGKNSDIPNIGGVRKDVIEALRHIKLPVLRWPGGCFADTYHWKDAVGPQEERKSIVNGVWGATAEDNSFGTDEFMNMCEEIGCDAYISGNLGTGTVQEMVDWVEYITGTGPSEMANLRRKNGREKPWNLKYFGIGNEVWGGGGMMTPEYYANTYRQYHTFLKSKGFGQQNSIQFIASGPSSDDYDFTDKVTDILHKPTYPMQHVSKAALMDGLSLHHYAFGFSSDKSQYFRLRTAQDFDETEWYALLKRGAVTDELIRRHDVIMSKYDPDKKIGLMVDEWGSWYAAEPGTNPAHLFQQNTVRDAVLAGIYLNIFNKHSDRVHMATCAQLINVLQAVILTKGDKMLLTPTYHVLDLFKEHMDTTLLGSHIENATVGLGEDTLPKFFESASVDSDGDVTITLVNTSYSEAEAIDATLYGANIKAASAEIVTGEPHACNTFDKPDEVRLNPHPVTVTDSGFKMDLPAASVVRVRLSIA